MTLCSLRVIYVYILYIYIVAEAMGNTEREGSILIYDVPPAPNTRTNYTIPRLLDFTTSCLYFSFQLLPTDRWFERLLFFAAPVSDFIVYDYFFSASFITRILLGAISESYRNLFSCFSHGRFQSCRGRFYRGLVDDNLFSR